MILQASNWEGLIYLAFYVSGLFFAKGISMHLAHTVFQKHASKVACLPLERNREYGFFFFFSKVPIFDLLNLGVL